MNPSSGDDGHVSAFAADLRWLPPGGAAPVGCLRAGWRGLACTSRGDSAFFLFVVTAALAFAGYR